MRDAHKSTGIHIMLPSWQISGMGSMVESDPNPFPRFGLIRKAKPAPPRQRSLAEIQFAVDRELKAVAREVELSYITGGRANANEG